MVALFDLDGTLCNARYLASRLIRHQFKYPTRIPRVVIYLIIQMASLVLWKIRLISYTRIVKTSNKPFTRLLKGLKTSEAQSLFSEAAQKTADTARNDILSILRWHQKEGHIVILVSGAFQPFLRDVCNLLGINHTVGTVLEEVNDRYTGKPASLFCHGDDRVLLINSFIKENGFDVDLPASYAYGDRVQDIPVLEMVGHPVAAYPDDGLLNYANERGWTVIGASRM